MKILYDHQVFSWQRYGGISNSFVQLIEHLPKDVEYTISVKYSDNIHLINSNLKKVKPRLTQEKLFGQDKSPFKAWLYAQFCRCLPNLTPTLGNRKASIRFLKEAN